MNKEQQKEQLREEAKQLLSKKGIKDTLFLNEEWNKGGLSVLLSDFAYTQLQQKEAELELKNSMLSGFTQLERQYNKEIRDLKAELTEANKKIDFLESKGLTVGYMKTSDKPEPYLVYVTKEGSEFDDTPFVIKFTDLELERDRLQAELTEAKKEVERCKKEIDKIRSNNTTTARVEYELRKLSESLTQDKTE